MSQLMLSYLYIQFKMQIVVNFICGLTVRLQVISMAHMTKSGKLLQRKGTEA